MNRLKQRFLALLLVALATGVIFAQDPVQTDQSAPTDQQQEAVKSPGGRKSENDNPLVDYTADLTTGGEGKVTKLLGNVIFHHNGAIIQCDSAYMYDEEDRMDFFSRVIINQDSTYIYGDKVVYNGKIDLATIYSPLVKMVNGEVTLYTYHMQFNTLTSIGTYWGGGMLTRDSILMESQRGIYDADHNIVKFLDEVAISSETYIIKTDSASYNIDTEVVTFLSRPYIWDHERDFLTADSGDYRTKTETYTFTGDAYAMTPDQEMWADTMQYLTPMKEAFMQNNVQITDTVQRTLAFGDWGYYSDSTKNAILTRNPSVVSYEDNTEAEVISPDSAVSVTESEVIISQALPVTDSLVIPEDLIIIPGDTLVMPDSLMPGDSLMMMPAAGDIIIADTLITPENMVVRPAKPAGNPADTTYLSADSIFMYSFPKGQSKSQGGLPDDMPSHEDVVNRVDSILNADSLMMASDSLQNLRFSEESERAGARTREDASEIYTGLPEISPVELPDEIPDGIREQLEENLSDGAYDISSANEPKEVVIEEIAEAPSPPLSRRELRRAVKQAEREKKNAEKARTITADSIPNPEKLAEDLMAADSLLQKEMQQADSMITASVDSTTSAKDSMERVIKAYHNVKMYRTDFQNIADSTISFSVDSTMNLFGRPVIWSEQSQLSSDRMDIYSKDGQLDWIDFVGNPLMVELVDSTTQRYNQASGKNLEAYFSNNELDFAYMHQNVINYYYNTDENGDVVIFGVVMAPALRVDFVDREPETLAWIGKNTSAMYPIEQIPEEQPTMMENFEWHAAKRPMSKEEVFNRRIRTSERSRWSRLQQPGFGISEKIKGYKNEIIKSGRWVDRTNLTTVTPEFFLNYNSRF